MTRVVSIRLPGAIAEDIRGAARSTHRSVSALVAWLLNIALRDSLNLSQLPDAREPLDDKLDLRLPEDLLHRLTLVCNQLGMRVSAYIRTLLYCGYVDRITLERVGGRYTLVANNDQN